MRAFLKRRKQMQEKKQELAYRGSNEIVAFVLLIVFILLVVAPPLKDLGETVRRGVVNINSNLALTLNEG